MTNQNHIFNPYYDSVSFESSFTYNSDIEEGKDEDTEEHLEYDQPEQYI